MPAEYFLGCQQLYFGCVVGMWQHLRITLNFRLPFRWLLPVLFLMNMIVLQHLCELPEVDLLLIALAGLASMLCVISHCLIVAEVLSVALPDEDDGVERQRGHLVVVAALALQPSQDEGEVAEVEEEEDAVVQSMSRQKFGGQLE